MCYLPSQLQFANGESATFSRIAFDGYVRSYYTYTPASVSGKVPLVVDLHGAGGCSSYIPFYSGWQQTAAEHGFVVVWPQGIAGDGDSGGTWNAGRCCGFAAAQDVDDVNFLRRVINLATAANSDIETNRVYFTGHSNGCMMGAPPRIPLASASTLAACL